MPPWIGLRPDEGVRAGAKQCVAGGKLLALRGSGGAGAGSLPLETVDERVGEVIRLGGPELPGFLQQRA